MRAYNDDDKCNKDIVPLKKAIDTIPCSSAECERGFSEMANILTDQRSNLTLENVQNLKFVHTNGPPTVSFKPTYYVEKWLRNHRSATDTKRRQKKELDTEQKILWDVL